MDIKINRASCEADPVLILVVVRNYDKYWLIQICSDWRKYVYVVRMLYLQNNEIVGHEAC
jgi:hypothetical protein